MKTITIISFLLLIGCSISVHTGEIQKAQQFCADKGGLLKITTTLNVTARCINGHSKMIKNIKLVVNQ